MKAVVVERAGVLGLRDIPEPVPGKYEVKVKLLAGSICNGTDAKILHGEFAGPFPTILGHEAAGRIIELGPGVRNYKIGDLVVRPRIGPVAGLSVSFGSFVEYGLATDEWAAAEDAGRERPRGHDQISSDPSWDPQTLVQAITLKETLSFLKSLGVGRGNSLLIYGSGPVGVSFSLWGRYLGCNQVIVVGRRDDACLRARGLGRATHTINNTREKVPAEVHRIVPAGVSHAVEAIGENAVIRDCLDSLATGGRLGIYGVAPSSQGQSALLTDPRISDAGPCEALVNDEVLGQIASGRIPAREFVTHELHFCECAKGFELLASRKAFKVALRFDD